MSASRQTNVVAAVVAIFAIAIVTLFSTQPFTAPTINGNVIAFEQPTVELEAPALVTGSRSVRAVANSALYSAQFSIDGTLYGAALTNAPFVTIIDSSQFAPGPHYITVALLDRQNAIVATDYAVFEAQ